MARQGTIGLTVLFFKQGGLVSGIPQLGLIDTHRSQRPPLPRLRPRGVPASLVGYELFHSPSVAQTTTFLSDFLGPAHLFLDGSAEGFEATVNLFELRGLSYAHLEFTTPITFEIPQTGEHVTVLVHTYGESAGLVGHRRIAADATCAIVTSPACHLRVSLTRPGSLLLVRLDRAQLEQTLSRMLGRRVAEPIAFEPVLDLAAGRAVRWNIAMQLLSAEVMTADSLLQRGIGATELEDLLSSSLLLLQPNNYSEQLVSHGGRKGLVHVATDHIEQHLGERLTTVDVAAAVHVGARSLQQAFHDALGMTPTEYIRDRRLERVHSDLVGASAGDGVSVTQTAAHWGFNHLGTFAALYKKRFGESPSQTLRGR